MVIGLCIRCIGMVIYRLLSLNYACGWGASKLPTTFISLHLRPSRLTVNPTSLHSSFTWQPKVAKLHDVREPKVAKFHDLSSYSKTTPEREPRGKLTKLPLVLQSHSNSNTGLQCLVSYPALYRRTNPIPSDSIQFDLLKSYTSWTITGLVNYWSGQRPNGFKVGLRLVP
ncbi:hypothetical protein VNO77_34453 [Canavalia gladiata]|uniref:Uncharacterized protein n=1 Tax=Canavalia gladiata TaxID=3824 RepID=A0AAN9KFJ9_CANGL